MDIIRGLRVISTGRYLERHAKDDQEFRCSKCVHEESPSQIPETIQTPKDTHS
jgi:hypothetical protein